MNPKATTVWSRWRPLGLALSPSVLAEILNGGQAFRWSQNTSGVWVGAWSRHQARLRSVPKNAVEFSVPREEPADHAAALRYYLALEPDPAALVDSLPWRGDPHLAACIAAFPGLRILRQPFDETLLCFLCSATKQISQIKEMVGLLAQRHGEPLSGGIHALPTWKALAGCSESTLRQCKLGFRARHISATARFLADHPHWLEETEALPYREAKPRLMRLPGVGAKIADCALLFGAGMPEAFPVDTWILKALARRYQLEGWTAAQLTQFGRVHFGRAAGLAQQYLFAHERSEALRHRTMPTKPRN